MPTVRESENHRLIGGELCLDFVNTLNGHTRSSPHEYLHDFQDLLLWGRHAGALSLAETAVLQKEAAQRPEQAQAIYCRSLELREGLFRIFSALAQGRRVEGRDLEQLNATWQASQRHTRLVPTGDRFAVGWDDEPCLESVLRRAAASAIQLLTSGRVAQMRACSGEGCDWLFIDDSRNHLRRWCSMDECGNRAKMKRRARRERALSANAPLRGTRLR